MNKHPKEAAYDDHVSPLMTQIIALCKEHSINMAATFALGPAPDSESDEPLYCTTVLDLDRSAEKEIERIQQCRRVMYPPRADFAAFIIYSGAAK
jgi:hypothetical protein